MSKKIGNYVSHPEFDDHSGRHENGGADEISIAGLDGTPTELTNHLNDATDAHDASAISVLDSGANFTATDVEAALAELQDNIDNASGTGAPTDATYIVQTANGSLSAEQALGALSTGILKNTTTTGVLSIAAEGTDYTKPGGTDVAVADGGTGSSSAAGARTNLGAAPLDAKYIVQTANSELSAEQALSSLSTGMLKVTTTTGVLSTGTEGTDYYKPTGTDVALADGGTGASLVDPNADRIMFWDDSAGSVAFLAAGTNLTITNTTIDAASGGASTPDDISLIVHMEVFA